MSIRKVSSLKISHHACLVLGGENQRKQALFDFPILGINEARLLRERASLASTGEEIILYCEAITEEGQNALLKTLEEPAPGLTFTILAPRSIQLSPTLLSRLAVSEVEMVSEAEDFAEIKRFTSVSASERLKIIANLLKQAEKRAENNKSVALKFLDNLEYYLARNVDVGKVDDEMTFALGEIRQGRVYLQDKSGAAKLILEHIALVLPALA